MSLYGKESYSQSKCIFLAGPIEAWWDTPENPDMWNSPEAVAYREHRTKVADALVAAGFLVYRPWGAFRGDWNEKFQGVNDYVLLRSDAVTELTPPNTPAVGTRHEVGLALRNKIPVIGFPPVPSEHFDRFMEHHIKYLTDAIDRWAVYRQEALDRGDLPVLD